MGLMVEDAKEKNLSFLDKYKTLWNDTFLDHFVTWLCYVVHKRKGTLLYTGKFTRCVWDGLTMNGWEFLTNKVWHGPQYWIYKALGAENQGTFKKKPAELMIKQLCANCVYN
ncbi:Uncharacterised protein r2_g68 [Pycnogonum litorale]